MTYSFHTDRKKAEIIRGRSGAIAFKADLWQILRRCLLIGTAQSTYYADRQELSNDFVDVLLKAIEEDPLRVATEIIYASDGRSINNSTPIYALTLLSIGESPAAKKAFEETFPKVIRTASHFYEWLNYSKSIRGFGKIVRQAGQAWFSRDNVKELAYQLLKYQSRSGFSHKDVLRLFHVKPASQDHNRLFEWVVKGWETLPEEIPSEAMAQIWWYEWLKRNPDKTPEAISKGHLTHEMAAPVGEMGVTAWQLLFNEMPIGALLRNLGSLTEIGVLKVDAKQNIKRVEEVLNSREYLRKGRIHPIDVLKALKTYSSGGRLGHSKKTWTPVPRIVDILEKALELSFEVTEPTGKVFLHAVDISSSMSANVVTSLGLTCCEIATTMSLVTAKAEKNYTIRGFSTEFIDLNIYAKDSFSSAIFKASNQNFGGTDATVAYNWAIKENFKADVICFWTDNESWAGSKTAIEALTEYREKINPNVKAVYISLTPYNISLVDPNDALSWDIGGFDPGIPRLIQMLATEEL